MTSAPTDHEPAPCGCRIELTETVENYLKAIFSITAEGAPGSTSGIAARLGVTSPSVTSMIRRLRHSGLVESTSWGQVVLTTHGQVHARGVVRRHRLLETFLHRVLGVSWDEIHEEAEVLEHYLSERLEHLIDAALGFPERDPHGDPIPRPTAEHEEFEEHGETPLADSAPGDRFLVQRVSDSDSSALRHLADLGILPGVSLEVERCSSGGGPMQVRVGERSRLLSDDVVNLICGELLAEEAVAR